MRATLTAAALTLTALLCAGSGLALMDDLAVVGGLANGAVDDTTAFAGDLASDAQAKAAAAGNVASAFTANVAGQANATGNLATALARNVATAAFTVVEMELHAVHGFGDAALACSAAAGAPFEAQACLAAAANAIVEA